MSQPPYLSALKKNLNPTILLPALTAGGSNAVLIVIIEISLAAMLFSQGLSVFTAQGIGILLLGSTIIGLFSALKSSHPSTIAVCQDAPIAILSIPLLSVSASIAGKNIPGEAVFYTILAILAVSTLIGGLIMTLMARFSLGNLVRFIPYPVIGGFLAGIGWILVKGGMGVMTGLPMTLDNIPALMETAVLIKWGPGIAFACLLYYLLRNYSHFLILPGMVLGTLGLFFFGLHLSGTSIAQAGELGWLLGPFPKGELWHPISISGLTLIRWDVVLAQSLTMASIFLISTISLLLNASGLEIVTRQDVDLNTELKVTGRANILAAFTGAPIGYMGLSTSALCHRLAPGTRLSGVFCFLLCGIVLLTGTTLVSGVPRTLAGGMLVFMGIDLLWEWLKESWTRLPKTDYVMIIIITGVIAGMGFLQGIGSGLVISVILFVVTYSRINIVKSQSSGKILQSNVERSAPHQWILNRKGQETFILQLQGYIFFGTANQLRNRITKKIRKAKAQPLKFIVLDFQKVTGFDSSALNSFERIIQLGLSQDIEIVFANSRPRFRAAFEKAGLSEGHIYFSPDLDHGLEWCEQKIIDRETALETDNQNKVLDSTFEDMWIALEQMESFERMLGSMAEYLSPMEMEAGQYLFRKDEPIQGIYLIESGMISICLEQENKDPIRIRTMGAGNTIGQWGDGDRDNSTSSVMVKTKGRIHYLSINQLAIMETNAPELTVSLYKYLTLSLSKRLSKTTRVIQDLI